MDKIVGKSRHAIACVLGLVFMSLVVSESQAVQVQICSHDGSLLKQAGVGVPFLLTVSSDAQDDQKRTPTIEGLEGVTIQNAGTLKKIINGVASSTYHYHVRIDKTGKYCIGPVYFSTPSQGEYATVTVGDEERVDKVGAEKPVTIARLALDNDHVFEGQSFHCILRCYVANSSTHITQVHEPHIQHARKQAEPVVREGQRDIDGSRYAYKEFDWTFVATGTGQQVVPACKVSYDVEQPVSFFSSFFNHVTHKVSSVYSNGALLDVAPLPDYDGSVQVVGAVRAFSAFVDQASARVGEGIVLTLRLEGDDAIDGVQALPLTLMPDEVKWYASKQSRVQPCYEGPRAKVFEYIIQAVQPGDVPIPSQEITYFDTTSCMYKTCATEAITLHITGGTAAYKHDCCNQAIDVTDSSVTATAEQSGQRSLPLNTSGAWSAVREHFLPWWLVIVLGGFPLFVLVARGVRRVRHWATRGSRRKLRKDRAFKVAYTELTYLEQRHEVAGVYAVFIRLFAARLETSESMVRDDVIEQVLHKAGFSQDDCERWTAFFAQAAAYRFSDRWIDLPGHAAFFQEARNWIAKMAKRL